MSVVTRLAATSCFVCPKEAQKYFEVFRWLRKTWLIFCVTLLFFFYVFEHSILRRDPLSVSRLPLVRTPWLPKHREQELDHKFSPWDYQDANIFYKFSSFLLTFSTLYLEHPFHNFYFKKKNSLRSRSGVQFLFLFCVNCMFFGADDSILLWY